MPATVFGALPDLLREPIDGESPWVSDPVLFGLSIWWVKATRPCSEDFSADVREVFMSLERDLRRTAPPSVAQV